MSEMIPCKYFNISLSFLFLCVDWSNVGFNLVGNVSSSQYATDKINQICDVEHDNEWNGW